MNHESNGVYDVIVIGAGVAGCFSAALAARSGLRVALLEKEIMPRPKVCGGCLNRRATQLLRQAGAGKVLEQSDAKPLRNMVICLAGRRATLAMNDSVVIGREQFDFALMKLAVEAGVDFRQGVIAEVLPEEQGSSGKSDQAIHTRCVRIVATELAHLPLPDGGDCGRETSLRGRVVLVCDGLSQSSLGRLTEFRTDVRRGSRIGASIVCDATPADGHLMNADLLMAVCSSGYAGSVFRSDGRVNLAVSMDAEFLRQQSSIAHAAAAILKSAGVRPPERLSELIRSRENAASHAACDGIWVKGTPPLTRSSPRLSADRVFLLGDSTGYVEPFTGEGMAWALTAASAVQPVIADVVAFGWTPQSEQRWNTIFSASVGRSQSLCRSLSNNLRRKWLLHPMMTLCQLFPFAAQSLVKRMNRMPAMLEQS
ncbi:MAG: FAD-dependent monooxygenase [Planctomycetaceae bacterium]|nr:FAD-dependent monooxygenase [Planctomycetaceae bacterium]